MGLVGVFGVLGGSTSAAGAVGIGLQVHACGLRGLLHPAAVVSHHWTAVVHGVVGVVRVVVVWVVIVVVGLGRQHSG